MFRNSVRYSLALAALASSVAVVPAALAQDETASSDAQPKRLGEVTVTAQRREQSLQDVPITVTAFTSEDIEKMRIQQFGDIVKLTPGLSFDSFPKARPRPFIRGIGSTETGAAADPSVVTFIDDVYLGRPGAIAFDLVDVERVEVLKGPQGTLFGRNAVGGAINIVTKKPELGSLGGSVELGAGNYGRFEAAGQVNLPVGDDKAAIRLSASSREHDGYTESLVTGADLDDENQKTIRGQLYFEPSDNFDTLFSIDSATDRANGPAQYIFALDTSSPFSTWWRVSTGRDDASPQTDGFQDRDTWGVRNETNWHQDWGTVSFIGSYRELDSDFYYDFDGGNFEFAGNRTSVFGGVDERAKFSSQEVRLLSPQTSAWDWVVGVYHFKQEVASDSTQLIYRTSSSAPATAPSPLPYELTSRVADLDSLAVFGDLTVPVSERVNVFGGVRYTEDDKDYHVWNDGSDLSNAFVEASEIYDVMVSDTFSAVTWRAGANFDLMDDVLLYAQVARGFKSGGFQNTPENAAEAQVPYDPEFATQYEIGQKGTFFDGRLIWNNSIYYTDYTDLQTRQQVGFGTVTLNAGAATIKGYETQLVVLPFEGAQVAVNYGYTDAKFDELIQSGEDLSGNRLSRVPEHKLVIAPSYEFNVGPNYLASVSGQYRYTSKIYDDNTNNDLEVREPSTFFDARIDLQPASGNWTFSIWGENLTDEETRTYQTTFLGINVGAISAPTTYGATLKFDF